MGLSWSTAESAVPQAKEGRQRAGKAGKAADHGVRWGQAPIARFLGIIIGSTLLFGCQVNFHQGRCEIGYSGLHDSVQEWRRSPGASHQDGGSRSRRKDQSRAKRSEQEAQSPSEDPETRGSDHRQADSLHNVAGEYDDIDVTGRSSTCREYEEAAGTASRTQRPRHGNKFGCAKLSCRSGTREKEWGGRRVETTEYVSPAAAHGSVEHGDTRSLTGADDPPRSSIDFQSRWESNSEVGYQDCGSRCSSPLSCAAFTAHRSIYSNYSKYGRCFKGTDSASARGESDCPSRSVGSATGRGRDKFSVVREEIYENSLVRPQFQDFDGSTGQVQNDLPVLLYEHEVCRACEKGQIYDENRSSQMLFDEDSKTQQSLLDDYSEGPSNSLFQSGRALFSVLWMKVYQFTILFSWVDLSRRLELPSWECWIDSVKEITGRRHAWLTRMLHGCIFAPAMAVFCVTMWLAFIEDKFSDHSREVTLKIVKRQRKWCSQRRQRYLEKCTTRIKYRAVFFAILQMPGSAFSQPLSQQVAGESTNFVETSNFENLTSLDSRIEDSWTQVPPLFCLFGAGPFVPWLRKSHDDADKESIPNRSVRSPSGWYWPLTWKGRTDGTDATAPLRSTFCQIGWTVVEINTILSDYAFGRLMATSVASAQYILCYSSNFEYWETGLFIMRHSITLVRCHRKKITLPSSSEIISGYKNSLSSGHFYHCGWWAESTMLCYLPPWPAMVHRYSPTLWSTFGGPNTLTIWSGTTRPWLCRWLLV